MKKTALLKAKPAISPKSIPNPDYNASSQTGAVNF
jgi:hypothetical protein